MERRSGPQLQFTRFINQTVTVATRSGAWVRIHQGMNVYPRFSMLRCPVQAEALRRSDRSSKDPYQMAKYIKKPPMCEAAKVFQGHKKKFINRHTQTKVVSHSRLSALFNTPSVKWLKERRYLLQRISFGGPHDR